MFSLVNSRGKTWNTLIDSTIRFGEKLEELEIGVV